MFVNVLTADDKYSGSNMQNLQQQHYLRNKSLLFLLHFWKVHEIYSIFQT